MVPDAVLRVGGCILAAPQSQRRREIVSKPSHRRQDLEHGVGRHCLPRRTIVQIATLAMFIEKERHMFSKYMIRALWSLLIAAVFTGYAAEVLRLALV